MQGQQSTGGGGPLQQPSPPPKPQTTPNTNQQPSKTCQLAASLGDAGSAPTTAAGAVSLLGGIVSKGSQIVGSSALPALAKVGPIAGYVATATSAVSAAEDIANGNYEDAAFEGVDTVVDGVLSSWGPLGAAAAGLYQLSGGSKFITGSVASVLCNNGF